MVAFSIFTVGTTMSSSPKNPYETLKDFVGCRWQYGCEIGVKPKYYSTKALVHCVELIDKAAKIAKKVKSGESWYTREDRYIVFCCSQDANVEAEYEKNPCKTDIYRL